MTSPKAKPRKVRGTQDFPTLLAYFQASEVSYNNACVATQNNAAAYIQALNTWEANPTIANAAAAGLASQNFNNALDNQAVAASNFRAAGQALANYVNSNTPPGQSVVATRGK